MEPWQKLIQILVEIWAAEDIKSGKFEHTQLRECSELEVRNDDKQIPKAA